MPRFHVPTPLAASATLSLPAGAARHAQVLRLQPGDAVVLFDGVGGEWAAHITRMGRSDVDVQVSAHHSVEREAPRAVTLATGMMSADRMDWLVEKATELGVVQLQPVLAERSSLRLDGERAQRKQQHWQAVAVSACEQSGRNRLPTVHAPQAMRAFLRDAAGASSARWLLSLDAEALPLRAALCDLPSAQPVIVLSGPEGGLSPDEEAAARAAGFVPVSLGHRVLRAETAPLAALSALTLV